MDWLGHIRTHTEALAHLSQGADPDLAVPTCPGWSMADLTWHMVDVQTFWEHIITNRPTGPDTYVEPPRPSSEKLPDRLRAACDALIAALGAADPADAAWSWSSDPADHTVAFTHRRQAHEAFVHRADAVAATGAAVPDVAPAFAADGLDEIVALNLSNLPDWTTHEPTDHVVRLRATDAERDWPLRVLRWQGTSPTTGTTYVDEDAVQVEPGAEPTAEVAGPAVELDLWLWGRRPADALVTSGDADAIRRLWQMARESTQ